MELQVFKHGAKGFIFTLLTSVILLVLLSLLFVYSQAHSSSSLNYLPAQQISSLANQISTAQMTKNQLNYTTNSTNYFVSEYFFQGKKTQLDSNKIYLSEILNKLSEKTNTIMNLSSIDYSDFHLFSENFNYFWNYSSDNLAINGSYSSLLFFFSDSPSLVSDNCTSTGGTVNIIINDIFNKTPQGNCFIKLNFTGEELLINYSEPEMNFSFSNITSAYFNVSATVSATSPLQIGEQPKLFTTYSVSNPGWTEPSYPSNTAQEKHYFTVSLYSNDYNVILIDSNSTGTYDYAYIDEDTDFTDGNSIELAGNNSKLFLNSNVFLLNIKPTGTQLKFTKLNAIHIEKKQYKLNKAL